MMTEISGGPGGSSRAICIFGRGRNRYFHERTSRVLNSPLLRYSVTRRWSVVTGSGTMLATKFNLLNAVPGSVAEGCGEAFHRQFGRAVGAKQAVVHLGLRGR